MFTVLMAWQKHYEALLWILIALGTLTHCRVVPGTRKVAATIGLKSNLQKRGNYRGGDSERPINYGMLLIGNAPLNTNRDGQTRESFERKEMKHNAKYDNDIDYQSDSAWDGHIQVKHHALSGFSDQASTQSIQNLLHHNPLVECGTDSMKLIMRGGLPHHPLYFMVDRGENAIPLPLMQVPLQCGHTRATSQYVIFTAPYLGCYGIQDGGSYVLPLLWSGAHVRMVCPVTPALLPSPSVSCYRFGMVVNLPQRLGSKGVKVKVMNEWQSISMVGYCDYNVMTHPGGQVITAPYTPCGNRSILQLQLQPLALALSILQLQLQPLALALALSILQLQLQPLALALTLSILQLQLQPLALTLSILQLQPLALALALQLSCPELQLQPQALALALSILQLQLQPLALALALSILQLQLQPLALALALSILQLQLQPLALALALSILQLQLQPLALALSILQLQLQPLALAPSILQLHILQLQLQPLALAPSILQPQLQPLALAPSILQLQPQPLALAPSILRPQPLTLTLSTLLNPPATLNIQSQMTRQPVTGHFIMGGTGTCSYFTLNLRKAKLSFFMR
ncbi:hypothetical protein COCON_G00092930 [Conger conger]|uniref:Uncharacterized protein n=1 Tax=Conger conger TaxID=82655 RepID=A0A9Q1DLM0_CONCO|nr:hypothetical protein COCON_G00092930 [Conger conger]